MTKRYILCMELKDGTLLFFDNDEQSWITKEAFDCEDDFFMICGIYEECQTNLDWLRDNYILSSSSIFIMEVTKTEPPKPLPLKFKRNKG